MGLMMSEPTLPWRRAAWAPRDIGSPRDFGDTVPTGPMPLQSCSGACDQGRKQCPHREACQLPEATLTEAGRFWLIYLVGVVLACLLAVHFIAGA